MAEMISNPNKEHHTMADGHVAEEKNLAVQTRQPLAFTPANLDELWRISEMLSKSMLAPPALQGKPYDCQLVLMTGYELGLSPTQSLRDIDVVKGRPYMRALLKVALVKQSPTCEYFRLVESSEKKAVFETKRKGEGVTRFEFSYDDAARAGVIGRTNDKGEAKDDNWTKWLRLMLRRRCASQLCDEVYPDVCRGIGDKEDLEEKEVEATATVTRIGVAPPPPAEVVPDPTPPKKERKVAIVDVPPEPAPVETPPLAESQNPSRPEGHPPMSEFDQIVAYLLECQTMEQVDDLSMKHVGYKGPNRQELAKLFKDRRAQLEKAKK